MRTLKKLTCLLLAMMMVFALAAGAYADDTTYCITIENAVTGHAYEAYQIFAGDYSGGKLSNVVWGNGISAAGQAALQDAYVTAAAGEKSAAGVAEALVTAGDAEAFAKAADAYLVEANKKIGTENNGNYTIAGLTSGYYLIKDAGPATDGQAFGHYIVKVVGEDVTVTAKVSGVSFEKKLKDKNDTAGTETDWQDSADYDIGDHVPFKLTAKVAEDFDQYTKGYYFAFHDTMGESLTLDTDTIQVFLDNKKITDGFTTTTTEHSFDVTFGKLKNVQNVTKNSVITVEYTATLNENAVLGNQGNVNQAQLEYSNNPYTEDKGSTAWDSVIVFTYKVVVNKIDGEQKPLTGAAFKLEKAYPKENGGPEEVEWKAVKEFTVSDESPASTFSFEGLDDGKYRLTETVTPAGYNTIEPITFTVTAEHDIEWTNKNQDEVLTSLSGEKETGEITLTASDDKSTLTTNVVNKSGSTLPETGGMGTTLFYVLGGVLVLAAVVLLVTKKRMNSEN